jgi:Beta protein
MNLSSAIYMPQLKWKFGELKAIGTAVGASSGRLLPLFVIPPAGAFDQLEGRTLGTAEYIRSFGAKLATHWQGGPVFVDGNLIDDDRHCNAVGQHALTELLERARLSHVMACPVTSMSRSSSYHDAVRRFRKHNPKWPICIRLSLSETDVLATESRVDSLLKQFDAVPSETVLLLDAGPIFVPDADQLASVIIETLAPLAGQKFAKVFWGATTFPEKHGLKAGEVGRWERSDWAVYERLLNRADELSIVPMFSDYGLEYPAHYKSIQVSPIAHLRYSSGKDYLMVRGSSTKKPNGYQAIFPVAEKLAGLEEFRGADYSIGNAYMTGLAARAGTTGHAGMWRWAATDHHLSLVLNSLGGLLHLPTERREVEPSERQMELI